MSGPKVVRVVTREELVAICHGQLARLDRALEHWISQGRRADALDEADIVHAQRRRDDIAALLGKDRFLDLQKSVPEEIAFLKADQQMRLEKAALKEARARTAARREAQAADALLGALRRSGRDIPAETEAGLEAAAAGGAEPGRALNAGFALLAAGAPDSSVRQAELARGLKGEGRSRSLEDWLGQQPLSADDAALSRIETGLAELTALEAEAAAPFERRLQALREGAGGERRLLLLDSLALDLGKALPPARELATARQKLSEAVAELSALDPQAPQPHQDDAGAGDLREVERRLSQVEAAILEVRARQAADARRRAVLEGLAALGYEVGAELTTAWVQDGRIVLKRPAHPGYGVELSGGATAERLQMRVVAFGEEPADAARDRDAETMWCGDVEALQARLASAGAAFSIEKALAVGAAPVKRVVVESDRDRAREGPAIGTQTLR